MLSRYFYLLIFPIFLINCTNKQLKTKLQIKSVTEEDIAAEVSSLPEFKNISIKNTSFLFKSNFEQWQFLLPYSKIVRREIFSNGTLILKSIYTITESNGFKLPKIVCIHFAVKDKEYDVEYSLKKTSINIPLN